MSVWASFLKTGTGPLIARKAETASVLGQPWLLGFVDTLQQPVAIFDESRRILAANEAFCRLIGTTRQNALGHTLREVGRGLFSSSDVEQVSTLIKQSASEGRAITLKVGEGPSLAVLHLNAQRISTTLPHGTVILSIEYDTMFGPSYPSLETAARISEQHHERTLSSIRAATHTIRQPLQTLSLLQGILAAKEKDPSLQKVVGRLQEAIEALAGMLNEVVAIEETDVNPATDMRVFPIDTILDQLRRELAYHADARGLEWHVVTSRAAVRSSPRLLQQVLRALLLDAIKLIKHGKILLGCRRRSDMLSIQVWIRGGGVPPEQQTAILDEFHRRDGSSGKSSIAQSLVKPASDLLGLAVKARSRAGNGLIFTADVPISSPVAEAPMQRDEASKGTVAVISDDPFMQQTLVQLLRELGHEALETSPADGFASLIPNRTGSMRPELVIFDSEVPTPQEIANTISALRWAVGWDTPVIFLTNELSRDWLAERIREPCAYLMKPVRPDELNHQIARLLGVVRRRAAQANTHARRDLRQTVFVVDDDIVLRDAVRDVLKLQGQDVELYSSSEEFLAAYQRGRSGCLVVDNMLPGMRGVELLERLKSHGPMLPAIMITGHSDISTAVRALKAGAIDYIEKPISYNALLIAIDHALEVDRGSAEAVIKSRELAARITELTPRERQVMDLVVSGRSSKQIAQLLRISQRTVENHRAAIMKRAGASSLPDLIRMVMQLKLSDPNHD